MDAISREENGNQEKMFEGHSDENEDRISHLPENIHQYILSFLPAKHAVRTSVLSTRWKNLWTLINNFDFHDDLPYCSKKKTLMKKIAFSEFVDKVLLVNNVSKVHRFSLKCKECSDYDFGKWMVTLMKRKVQELIISVEETPSYYFPICLFTKESLRILKIHMDISVNGPNSISLLWLKVLHLERVTFFGTKLEEHFLLSCPVLEEFALRDCKWLDIKTVNISVPKLQRLTIKDWCYGNISDCKIKIDAQSLISLKAETDHSYEYSLCHLSSLVDVVLEFRPHYRSPEDKIVHRLGSILSGIHNVRDLEVNGNTVKTLSLPCFSDHRRSFSRVTNLRVVCRDYSFGKDLIDILGDWPNIESLTFPYGFDSFTFKGSGRILGTTSQTFLSYLKRVEIKCFRGINEEFWFVKFLIKSVRAMDKWTMKFPRDLDAWVVARLESLRKNSRKDSNCDLIYSH
ncbi:hypothetical protein ACHQM5_013846 [Ranunculus cassubicifolius]